MSQIDSADLQEQNNLISLHKAKFLQVLKQLNKFDDDDVSLSNAGAGSSGERSNSVIQLLALDKLSGGIDTFSKHSNDIRDEDDEEKMYKEPSAHTDIFTSPLKYPVTPTVVAEDNFNALINSTELNRLRLKQRRAELANFYRDVAEYETDGSQLNNHSSPLNTLTASQPGKRIISSLATTNIDTPVVKRMKFLQKKNIKKINNFSSSKIKSIFKKRIDTQAISQEEKVERDDDQINVHVNRIDSIQLTGDFPNQFFTPPKTKNKNLSESNVNWKDEKGVKPMKVGELRKAFEADPPPQESSSMVEIRVSNPMAMMTSTSKKKKKATMQKYYSLAADLEIKYQEQIYAQRSISVGLKEFYEALSKKSDRKKTKMAALFSRNVVEANKEILVAVEHQNILQRELEKLRSYLFFRSIRQEKLLTPMNSPSLNSNQTLLKAEERTAWLPYDETSYASLAIRKISLSLQNVSNYDFSSAQDHFLFCLVEHKSNLMATEVISVKSNLDLLNKRTSGRLELPVNILISDLKPDFEVAVKFFVMQHKTTFKKSLISQFTERIQKFLKKIRKVHYKKKKEELKNLAMVFQVNNIQRKDLESVKPFPGCFQMLGEFSFNRRNSNESRFLLDHFDYLKPFEDVAYVDVELTFTYHPKSSIDFKQIYEVQFDVDDLEPFQAKLTIDRHLLQILHQPSQEKKCSQPNRISASMPMYQLDLRNCINPAITSMNMHTDGSLFEKLLFKKTDMGVNQLCLVFTEGPVSFESDIKTFKLLSGTKRDSRDPMLSSRLFKFVFISTTSIDDLCEFFIDLSTRLNAIRQWVSPKEMLDKSMAHYGHSTADQQKQTFEQVYWSLIQLLEN